MNTVEKKWKRSKGRNRLLLISRPHSYTCRAMKQIVNSQHIHILKLGTRPFSQRNLFAPPSLHPLQSIPCPSLACCPLPTFSEVSSFSTNRSQLCHNLFELFNTELVSDLPSTKKIYILLYSLYKTCFGKGVRGSLERTRTPADPSDQISQGVRPSCMDIRLYWQGCMPWCESSSSRRMMCLIVVGGIASSTCTAHLCTVYRVDQNSNPLYQIQ